jgi:hypothetical protein
LSEILQPILTQRSDIKIGRKRWRRKKERKKERERCRQMELD